jgi:predicted dehydrogenase
LDVVRAVRSNIACNRPCRSDSPRDCPNVEADRAAPADRVGFGSWFPRLFGPMMVDAASLRVGVVACSRAVGDRVAAWRRRTGAHVVALCDPSGGAQPGARDSGTLRVYETPSAMFDGDGLDAVDIVGDREIHADVVRLAMRHNVQVLCDAPLGTSYAETEALLREIGGSIRVMISDTSRYRSHLVKIGEWLRSDRLGTVVQARLSLCSANRPATDGDGVAGAVARPLVPRGGRLLIAESLVDALDVARSLFGELEVLAATTGRASVDGPGEDCAAILMRTEYGLTVVVDGVMSGAGHSARADDRVEIAGTRCSVRFENAELRLSGAESETVRFDEADVRRNSLDRTIQHFIDQVRSGGPFWTSAADHLATLRLVEHAYELADEPMHLGSQRLPPTLGPMLIDHA